MYELLAKPDIVTKLGQYKTRSGEVVKVERVSKRQNYMCTGTYSNGVAEGWHKSGRLLPFNETPNDIVEQAQ